MVKMVNLAILFLFQFTRVVSLDIFEFLELYQYRTEEHYVLTEDNYVLGMQRITSGQDGVFANEKNKPPVLMVHGLEGSCMDFVNMGPRKSLALMLADVGYDVWLGNVRGNTYSRNHTSLDNKQRSFYQFSFHEVGQYDLPAKIDYILKATGFEKLSFVGYSEGATVFFIMGAIRPEYNDKIQIMAALAPVVYMKHFDHPIIKRFSNPVLTLAVGFWLSYNKYYLVLPHYDIFTKLGESCALELNLICRELYYLIGGKDDDQFVQEMLSVILSNAPAGASYTQFTHYFQLIRSGSLQAFDYGLTKNRKVYGQDQKSPPEYGIYNITAPVAVYYSKGDPLTNFTDVRYLIKELSNVVHTYLVPSDDFSHFDYLWAKDVDELLNNNVVQLINRYNGAARFFIIYPLIVCLLFILIL